MVIVIDLLNFCSTTSSQLSTDLDKSKKVNKKCKTNESVIILSIPEFGFPDQG